MASDAEKPIKTARKMCGNCAEFDVSPLGILGACRLARMTGKLFVATGDSCEMHVAPLRAPPKEDGDVR
jgi:hypothetical protein